MIKLKHILLEKDEKSDSENPDKILVKNKESGKSYYISKDSFDASKHEKSDTSDKKPKKDEPEEKSSGEEEKTGKKKKEGGADLTGGPTPSDEKKKEKPEEKKFSPQEKLANKLGSFVFITNKEQETIQKDVEGLRPDLKKRLLKFEFTKFFRNFDDLVDTLKTQKDVKDEKGIKETAKALRDTAEKIQKISIAKLAALSTFDNDPKTISSAKYYHTNSNAINHVLRQGDTILSKKEIEKREIELKNNPQKASLPEFDSVLLKSMKTIHDLDDHFKSSGAVLRTDTVVFRGVSREVLSKFVKAGEWIDNAFVSTSLNPLIAENFTERDFVSGNRKERTPVFRIKLNRGNRVLMLPCGEDEYCIESEITLPRSCKFKIENYDKKKNIYNVSVEFPNA